MVSRQLVSLKSRVAAVTGIATLVVQLISPAIAAAEDHSRGTRTPIQHVIVIIGENRTFDHVFATYKPKKGESVDNLLSKGIVNENGTPGPNFALAAQSSAIDSSDDGFRLSPSGNTRYSVLPPALAGGYSTAPFPDVATAKAVENGLPNDYYVYLTTGGTGLAHGALDTRIPNADKLPNGPFQLTSATHPYDTYDNSPVHRFYQMWQQFDCKASRATRSNPSGCKNDLWPWVETTIGAGSNGKTQPSGFNDTSTGEGSTAMGFYNVLQGDAPYFKFLAANYAMSDNFHQSVMGGTGANHVMLGTGDGIWFSDGRGHARRPPHNEMVAVGSPNAGVVDEVENPNPQVGTNNWYTQDGYGSGSFGSPSSGGGTYSECADSSAPGVSQLVRYLRSLPKPIDPNCDPGHYYLLNNYVPSAVAPQIRWAFGLDEFDLSRHAAEVRPFRQSLRFPCRR
jgi:phospholipase C